MADNRTRVVNLLTPKGEPYSIVINREVAAQVDGQWFTRPSSTIRKSLSDVAAQTVTLSGGQTVSAAQVAEAISLFADLWDNS